MHMKNIALSPKHPRKYAFVFQASDIFKPHPCLRLSSVKLYDFFNVRMTLSWTIFFLDFFFLKFLE